MVFKIKKPLDSSNLTIDSKEKFKEEIIECLKQEIFESLMKDVKNTITLIENSINLQEDILENISLDISQVSRVSQEVCKNPTEIEFTFSKDIQTNDFLSLLEPQQEKYMVLHPTIQQEIEEIEKQIEDEKSEKPFYGDIVLQALLNISDYSKHLGPDA